MPDLIRLRLTLKQLSPIALAAKRGTTSGFIDTLDYIPGTALRGATAARYFRDFGDAADRQFQEIFVNSGVLFANLYPVKYAANSRALPTTAYACKAHEEDHDITDILTRASALNISDNVINQTLLDQITLCRICGRPSHGLSGFYEKKSESSTKYDKVEVHKRHLMHVGINREKQTAEDGFLYAQQVINEKWREKKAGPKKESAPEKEAGREKNDPKFKPQMFSGDLIVDQTHADFLMDELLSRGTTLFIGESRTRGLGRLQIHDCDVTESDTEDVVSGRIEKLNTMLEHHNGGSNKRKCFALTLQSDAILTDTFMRPKSQPGADDIRRALGDGPHSDLIADDALKLKYSNAAWRIVHSWNMASGYPKPDDIAIKMGSVFLFEISSGNAGDFASLLTSLQERGIGKRRNEGFGRVKVCDPFHLEDRG